MKRLSLHIMIAFIAALGLGSAVTAQSEDDVTAAIHAGMCSDLGEEVATLNDPQPESGSWIGVEGLGQVLESETDDVIRGDTLIDSAHSIVIFANGEPVACGEIGGYADDDDLYIGLQPVGNSGYFGIADLDDIDDDDDEVEIDLYVFQPNRE